MEDVIYWEAHYISCEENNRWTYVKTPSDWNENDVGDALLKDGSCGDDPAKFLYAIEANADDAENSMYYDFT